MAHMQWILWCGLCLGFGLVLLNWTSEVETSRSLQALSLYGDDDDDVITSGPFANLMRPHEMQPIYLLPLTNGVKQLLTFCVFGFDFKTDFKKGSAMKKLAGFFVAYLAKLVFIFLAFNSYVSDFRKFQSREAHNLDNFWQSSLVFLAIWCTSHNFSASLGLWGSFTIQSPAVIFKKDIDKSRYLEAASCWGIEHIRFPFFLGGARWLQHGPSYSRNAAVYLRVFGFYLSWWHVASSTSRLALNQSLQV
eukprot:symbB.v1.2.021999.t1/scaffold1932.1/size98745/1